MVVARDKQLENAMFDAFAKTLELEGAWYEYVWFEFEPRYTMKRNWYGKKRQVLLAEEKVTKCTATQRIKYTIMSGENKMVFEPPKPFVAKAETYDLTINFYASLDSSAPFMSQIVAKILQPGDTYTHIHSPELGLWS